MPTYTMTETLAPREMRIRDENGEVFATLTAAAFEAGFYEAIKDRIAGAGDRLMVVNARGRRFYAVDPS